MNNKPAISKQSVEHILWANNMLEVQNDVLQQSCADYRKQIAEQMAEIETLKTTNAVLKCTVQRISGV